VVGGSGTLFASGAGYTMDKNDMYIIQPGMDHSLVSDSSDPLCTIEVKALVNDPQLDAYLKQMSLKMVVPNTKIKLILEAMLDEATHCRPQYKEIITANFIEIIMNLQRSSSIEQQESDFQSAANPASPSGRRDVTASLIPGKSEFGDDLASMTLQYFHTNYDRKILLKELAQHLTVSHAHLCRVFCDRYKVSPMQYLNNWRIQEAKELLINTEMSITEISTKVGFQSVHYLSRRFTAKEKMSPLQYRQKMKEITELKIDEKFDIVDNMVVMHG
jgi:AraC-like DNA-binding protein